jgi:hypothetical protein
LGLQPVEQGTNALTAVIEKPDRESDRKPDRESDQGTRPDDPKGDVARADAVAQLIAQRLTEAEVAAITARDELAGLALLAEIDATVAVKRDEVRARLAVWLSHNGMDRDAELLDRLAARAEQDARRERYRVEARGGRRYRSQRYA